MDWTVVASMAVAWLGQVLKSLKAFPTAAAQAITFAVAFAFYAVGHHYTATDAEWFQNGVLWALAVLGVGSVAGHTKLAPETDSK